MQEQKIHASFKLLGFAVLALMGCSMLYAFIMTLMHWSDIAV